LLTRPGTVVQPDGVIHGIKRLLVPRCMQEEPNALCGRIRMAHRRSACAAPGLAATATNSYSAGAARIHRAARAAAEPAATAL
jgi:hypothetical protein